MRKALTLAWVLALTLSACSACRPRPGPVCKEALCRYWPWANCSAAGQVADSTLLLILQVPQVRDAAGPCDSPLGSDPLPYFRCIKKEAQACYDWSEVNGSPQHSVWANREHTSAECQHLCQHVQKALAYLYLAVADPDHPDVANLALCLKELNHEDGGPEPANAAGGK